MFIIYRILKLLSTATPELIRETNSNLILWIIGIILLASIIAPVIKTINKTKNKSNQAIEIAKIRANTTTHLPINYIFTAIITAIIVTSVVKANKTIAIKTIEARKEIELAKINNKHKNK